MSKQEKGSLFEHYGLTEADEKAYPVISSILKRLTPAKIKSINQELSSVMMLESFAPWIDRYNIIGEVNRNEYFWRWLQRTVQTVTLPIVSEKMKNSIFEVKLLILLFVVLFDDIADKQGVRNRKFLEELLNIPIGQNYFSEENYSDKEKEHIRLTVDVWRAIREHLSAYPRYGWLEDIFHYDVLQLLNAMRYSYLVNSKLSFMNPIEYWAYLPHNMQAIISLDIDLMTSEYFEKSNMGVFREIAWEAQKMARIGNWVSTWEREIDEQDYTSLVFAEAVTKKVVSLEDLANQPKKEIVQRIRDAKIEKEVLKDWENSYNAIKTRAQEMESPKEISIFLSRLEDLIAYHLSSSGYK